MDKDGCISAQRWSHAHSCATAVSAVSLTTRRALRWSCTRRSASVKSALRCAIVGGRGIGTGGLGCVGEVLLLLFHGGEGGPLWLLLPIAAAAARRGGLLLLCAAATAAYPRTFGGGGCDDERACAAAFLDCFAAATAAYPRTVG